MISTITHSVLAHPGNTQSKKWEKCLSFNQIQMVKFFFYGKQVGKPNVRPGDLPGKARLEEEPAIRGPGASPTFPHLVTPAVIQSQGASVLSSARHPMTV